MSTPEARPSQEVGRENMRLATLGTLEWVYTGAVSDNSFKSDVTQSTNNLPKKTAGDIIVRVQRDPNTQLPTREIADAGPIWLASAFVVPAGTGDAPYARDFDPDDSNSTGTFESWIMKDGKLNTKRAGTARCWTFEEAVEAGARLASALTDS